MAVPDTNTFSLGDVVTELGLGAGSSLGDCFSAANSSSFDPAYEGSKDRLSNFRNYGAESVQSFLIHLSPFASSAMACAHILTDSSMYYFGSDPYPSAGDTIYTDMALTNPFNGGGSWYKLGNNTSIQVDASGMILTAALC